MKNYTITVNGNIYDVTVEEKGNSNQTAQPSVVQPVAVRESRPAPQQGGGKIGVVAGAAGKVFKIEAAVGQAVKKGDSILIIEAMKMEIPVVAPQDGVVASIDAATGDTVEAGATLATLN